jgi:serine/threonine-protein kinase RsbW
MQFDIPSGYAEGRRVQQAIMDRIEQSGFSTQEVFAIKLALEEALINAIKHGNRLDPTKKVHVEASVKPGEAEIIIEDEGPGFARHHVPDPRLDENLEKCSGRGILLIEAYMSEVEWSKDGRRVRMIKREGA